MTMMWQRLEFDVPVLPVARMQPARASAGLPRAFSIEILPLITCRAIHVEWSELASRAIEPNVFAGPDMLLATAHHLPSRHMPAAMVIRAAQAYGAGKLLAVIPLETSHLPLLPDAMRGFSSPYHPVGVPLVDKAQAVPVLRATFDWLAAHGGSADADEGQMLGASGMLWKDVPLEGAFAQAARQAAALGLRQVDILAPHDRPVLTIGVAQKADALPAKLRDDLAKAGRRLARHGALRFEEAPGGAALREAIETFMVLEASSWKGQRGTAMVQNARLACFIRAASRMMSRNGQCSVLSLFAGETPVAAAIILESGNRSWGYKIAYDAGFAKASPGLLLLAELRRRQLAKKPGHVFDSCMSHPTPAIAQFWTDSASYGDMLVATTPGRSPGAVAMRLRERMRRNLRQVAKTLYRRAMGHTR